MVLHALQAGVLSFIILWPRAADAYRFDTAEDYCLVNVSSSAISAASLFETKGKPGDYIKENNSFAEGGFGQVFKARRSDSGKEEFDLVIKEALEGETLDPAEETVMKKKLPFVAELVDTIEEGKKKSLVMPWYKGGGTSLII
eukprot:TRINITY_DN5051_c0_g3_i1.p2 TRINITY_DN5051_c0_g3~~TRINITY_DN5051_c0_g3_i1.p2  ORF type:complete len:143 (+),score=29.17 TRINITY_DN5051_c0_g3_i1:69-497(+)